MPHTQSSDRPNTWAILASNAGFQVGLGRFRVKNTGLLLCWLVLLTVTSALTPITFALTPVTFALTPVTSALTPVTSALTTITFALTAVTFTSLVVWIARQVVSVVQLVCSAGALGGSPGLPTGRTIQPGRIVKGAVLIVYTSSVCLDALVGLLRFANRVAL